MKAALLDSLDQAFQPALGVEAAIRAGSHLIDAINCGRVDVPKSTGAVKLLSDPGMPWWSRFVVDGQCVPFSNSTHRGRIVLSCCASIDHFVIISRDSAGELVLTGPANSDACLPDGKSTQAVVQWLGIKANMDQVSWLGKFMGRSDVETWCTVFGAASVYLFNASAAEFSWKLPRRGEDLLTDYEVTAMFQWSRTLVSTLVS